MRMRTDSAFPSFTASVFIITFPSRFSAEVTFVFSLNLMPCFVKVLWNCLLQGSFHVTKETV